MIRKIALGTLLALALSVSAVAAPITLTNWDLETTVTGQFGGISDWGPNGGWALHAGFAKPGNETLGLKFGYYSSQTSETIGQLTTTIIAADTTYKFWSFLNGGGDNTGLVPYEIGYAATAGNRASFVVLARNLVTIDGTWTETGGVTYTTSTTGDEIGKELIVRLGSGAVGGSDAWFDSFQATATPATSQVPEPGSLLALSSGVVGLVGFGIRRKRA